MHQPINRIVRIRYCLFFLYVMACCTLNAQEGFFSSKLSVSTIDKMIVPTGTFKPLPKAGDPHWKRLPAGVKAAYIKEAEKNTGKPWEVVTASEFMEFSLSGNRLKHEFKLFDQRSRLEFAVIAELMEDRGRFMNEIINGIWKICEESWWGVPAHSKTVLPDVNKTPFIDLFDSETAQMMSWIHYLMKDKLDKHSPIICERIEAEIKKRMLELCLDNDYWWKTGHANWTTWITSNWLTASLLIEDKREQQIESIRQVLIALDGFYQHYPEDGGCDEGPAYWSRAAASMFESLDLLHMASDGQIDFSSDPKIRQMGSYIWKMHIHDFFFVNFADARPAIVPNISSIYRFGTYIQDENMKKLARYIALKQDYQHTVLPNENYLMYNDRAFLYGLGRQLLLLNRIEELFTGDSTPPIVQSVWLDKLQIFTARHDDKSSAGFYFAAKGGHNDENHNHNDVGSFCLFADGIPLLVDLGVEQYTGKTFGKNRYAIWTMQSAFHNLPTINGVMQRNGREYEARNVRVENKTYRTSFSLDIAKAYPQEAMVRSWKRFMRLSGPHEFIVKEKYQLEKVENESFLSLMVDGDVTIDQAKNVVIKARDNKTYALEYDKRQLKAEIEFYPVEDAWLKVSWKNGIHRIKLTCINMKEKGEISYKIKKIVY